jgi:hypothetical protein
VAFYLGDGRVSCHDVEKIVWPRSAASAARWNRTIRGAGAALVGLCMQDSVSGERTGQEECRSAWEGDVDSAPATCLTQIWLPKHSRWRTEGRGKG